MFSSQKPSKSHYEKRGGNDVPRETGIYSQQAPQIQFVLYPLPLAPSHSWLLLEFSIWSTVPRQWDSLLNAQALDLGTPKWCPRPHHLFRQLISPNLGFPTIEMGPLSTYPVELCNGIKVRTGSALRTFSWNSRSWLVSLFHPEMGREGASEA